MLTKKIKVASVLCIVALLTVSCVSPSYVATRVACSSAEPKFNGLELDGREGLTDLSYDITVPTAMRLLRERRIGFFEQKSGKTAGAWPLWVIRPDAPADSFVRLEIAEASSSECISGRNYRFDGTLYDLYTFGMKPTECVKASVTTKPSGRFFFQKDVNKDFDATIIEHSLVDQNGESAAATIRSARSSNPPGSYGGAIIKSISPRLEARCVSDPQSIVNAFARSQTNPHQIELPEIRELQIPKEMRSLAFRKSPILEKKFDEIVETQDSRSVVTSKNMERALVLNAQQFVGHFGLESWRGCKPKVLYVGTYILVLGFDAKGLMVSRFDLDGVSKAGFIGVLEESTEPILNEGGCGGVAATVYGEKLLIIAYPKDRFSNSSRGVYETSLHSIIDVGAI